MHCVSPKTPKDQVLREIKNHVKRLPLRSSGRADHHAAILASQDFATWLDDQSFMGSLLQTLYESSLSSEEASQIDILAGVVDGIPSTLPLSDPHRGLSILYSSTSSILPNLWDPSSFSPETEQDKASSVSFLSNPLAGDPRTVDVTIPLANTIFQNGRRSTLFASRWQKGPSHSLVHEATRQKQTQKVAPRGTSVNHTLPFLPLLPLIAPRKIVAGLGNILRQVEVDGSPSPASKELEVLIPQIFDVREKRYGTSSSGPIGVWAWVIPPHVVETEKLLDLKVFKADSAYSEAELATEAVDVFSRLTSSGCRLHKILSGGGGWGLKQGLLSLDPETSYAQLEQDDIDLFIKAFQERDSPSHSGGLVTPGSYVLFCIEPHLTNKDTLGHRVPPSISLSVAPTNDEGVALRDGTEEVKVLEDHFGAASTGGLFLRTTPELDGSSATEGSEAASQPFTTKISVPRACLSLGLS
ncbi:hypothetical protein SLS62_010847 [Diatrype stigma]|uniref:V-type c subunit family protein n=1 Tax=Diatrype stigma TaxID=117547 RepID=A0AAN9YFA3_9PEZI